MSKNKQGKKSKQTAKQHKSIRTQVEEMLHKIVLHLHNPAEHKKSPDQYVLTDSVEEKMGPALTRLLTKKVTVTDHDLAILAESYVLSWSHSDPLRLKGEKKTTYYSGGSYGTNWQPNWQKKDDLVAEADDVPFDGGPAVAGTVAVKTDTDTQAEPAAVAEALAGPTTGA